METQDYNGWTNRETWATMLHIDNDYALHEIAMDYARGRLEENEGDLATALYYLGENLEGWIVDDLLTLENVAGNQGLWLMLTDIGSLYRVNWREIAETLLERVKEEATLNV